MSTDFRGRTGQGAKARLLVVSTEMHIGGVTTALLSLLNTLSSALFTVDLLLYEHSGPLQDQIPAWVRLLPEGKGQTPQLRKLCSPAYVVLHGRALAKRLRGRPLQEIQLRARAGARFSRRLAQPYDLAISFIEFWPLYYTARYVKARRKLAWIHVDYDGSDLNPKLDQAAFASYDRIVAVSEQCADNFRRLCPPYAARCLYLPNLCSRSAILKRAARPAGQLPKAEAFSIRLVSVCRVVFAHKGLDRGLEAFARLRSRGKLAKAAWYIVGDGPDSAALARVIAQYGLEEQVFPLGSALEPLPLMAQCDAFFLPSRYEGKPLAVTEAMNLGLPALVTRYASAAEQVEHGVDGWIAENSLEGVEQGLEALCETPGLLERLKQNARGRSYGNERDITLYYQLFAQLGLLSPGWEAYVPGREESN